jgi:hypothetical protein
MRRAQSFAGEPQENNEAIRDQQRLVGRGLPPALCLAVHNDGKEGRCCPFCPTI